jgi:hypothetical protein
MPNGKTPPKNGTITQANEAQQKVTCDDGEVIYLLGINRIQGAQDGDRVHLTLREMETYTLWFGHVSARKVTKGLRSAE